MQYTYNGWSGVTRMENNEPPLMQCYSNPKKAKLTAQVRHSMPGTPQQQGTGRGARGTGLSKCTSRRCKQLMERLLHTSFHWGSLWD